MTDRTAPSSDARKRNAERGVTFAEAADLIKARMPRSLATPDQEPPMSKTDRHDELVALLRRIADTLDGFRGAPDLPTAMATNLEAIKHEAETPMRGHGECCEPAPAEAEDERISAWHRVADHPFFRGCYAEERPLIDAMLDRLTLAATAAGTVHNHGPAQGRDCSERTDGHVHIRGMCMASAPADDLPGEPVEPGDLRAGDRVAFTWLSGERMTCALVEHPRLGGVLHSDVTDASGVHRPNLTSGDLWATGISDVRLLERAPREDEDPDEALAMDLYHARLAIPPAAEIGRTSWDDFTHRKWLDVARAARERIESEWEEVAKSFEDGRDKWQAEARQQRDRAERAEAERDALRERLDALRDDIVNGRLLSAAEAAFGGWLIARDDERAAKGEPS